LTGSRKYRFALLALLALILGFGFTAWRNLPADLFGEYGTTLVLLVAAFGTTNGIEHISGAVKARREAKP
jgi:hypothetical protein